MTVFIRQDSEFPYAIGNLPDEEVFTTFRKKTLTRAVRVKGPFEVKTREGTLTCQDGWLALDSGGNPYPVAADEFENIYEEVGGGGE